MARLEFIHLPAHPRPITNTWGAHARVANTEAIRRLPQIFWADHTPWEEANLWAYTRVNCDDVNPQTVESNMRGLAHYAAFLEEKRLDWRSFPIIKAERCIVRYRGFLKSEIKHGKLAPSTASSRMRCGRDRRKITIQRAVYSRGQLRNLFCTIGPLTKYRLA